MTPAEVLAAASLLNQQRQLQKFRRMLHHRDEQGNSAGTRTVPEHYSDVLLVISGMQAEDVILPSLHNAVALLIERRAAETIKQLEDLGVPYVQESA